MSTKRPDPTWIDVNDARLPYWRVGRGPDLLFIHGWPLSSLTFRQVVPILAEQFTCHLIDLPGAGQSRWTDATPISLTGHAQTVAAVIEQLGLEHVTLIAHDSGATIARLVAAEQPGRIAGLVLGNTEIPGHRPWQVRLYQLLTALPLGARIFAAFLSIGFLRRSSLAMGGSFADVHRFDREVYETLLRPLVEDRRARDGQLRLLRGFDWSVVDGLAHTHRQIVAPTLFIWGERDRFFPLAHARPMVGQFAGEARLEVVPGAKLMVHEEFPQRFAALTAEHVLSLGQAAVTVRRRRSVGGPDSEREPARDPRPARSPLESVG
ncbi:alpha/beta fold hydrolase [Haliangium sp.]|uniref:alpha/beta fold hydrolase n=1 Tax=Haliangium sp. TaxID=2663208 RepID=UPI003D0C6D00